MHKIIITCLFLCVISDRISAQDTITIYYNNNWEEISSRDDATFYRKAFVDTNNVWAVNDFYMSDKIQMTGTYKSRKLSTRQGYFTYYFENGLKSSEGNFSNDKADATWIYWHDNGQKKSTGEFKTGQEDGRWIYWHESGEKKSEGFFLKGKKNGIWNYWNTEGILIHRETYNPNGTFVCEGFYENGVMSYSGIYVDGHAQGKWTYWNSDGRINASGNFENGLREGLWIRSFPVGEMKVIFKNGIPQGKLFGSIVRTK